MPCCQHELSGAACRPLCAGRWPRLLLLLLVCWAAAFHWRPSTIRLCGCAPPPPVARRSLTFVDRPFCILSPPPRVQAAGFTPTTRFAFSPDGTFGTFEGDLPNGYLERDRVKAEEFLSEHFNTFLEATTVMIQAWYRGARSRRECAPPPPDPPPPSPPPSEPADSTAEVEEGEAGFQLLVVNFAGTTVTLDGCLVSDTIDVVAGAFATKLDLPKRIVRLMLEGTQLDAEYTLAHYQITAGCQLHALPRLPGGVPPGDDQREAAAGGGGPAPKKRTQKHAAAGSRSVVGGSGSANSDGGASGSKRARAGPPTKLKSVLDHSQEHGSGRWRGQDVSSEDESLSDVRVAAEEPAAAADEAAAAEAAAAEAAEEEAEEAAEDEATEREATEEVGEDDFEVGKRMYARGEPAPSIAMQRKCEGYRAAEAMARALAVMATFEGLDGAKTQIRRTLFSAIDRLQEHKPISILQGTSHNYNMFITGNSGVGKSDLVKLVVYPALKQLGVLTGELVMVSVADLKGAGLNEKMEEARGGMLFCDEAYGATKCGALTTEIVNKFPKQGGAIMLVVAGYKKEMGEWRSTNSGLAARFEHFIDIRDYSAEELVRIGTRVVEENKEESFELGGDARGELQKAAEHVTRISPGTSPANADAIRCVMKEAIVNFRVRRQNSRRGRSMLRELTSADIKAGLEKLKTKADALASSSCGAEVHSTFVRICRPHTSYPNATRIRSSITNSNTIWHRRR